MTSIKVLHITTHLGGGVGKALSGLVIQSSISNSEFKHDIVCLEKNKKRYFVNEVRKYGCNIFEQPNINELENLMKKSDIIQIEWWNHPLIFKFLYEMTIPPIRLLTWYHNSGLYTPILPKGLILNSHTFIFTSECSYESKTINDLNPIFKDNLGVVHSSGGFKELPNPENDEINKNEKLSVGYIGSTNFSKMHPRYTGYLSRIDIPNFKVKIIGDAEKRKELERQCIELGITEMLEFTGYVQNIVHELKKINVLAYILNSKHYGTTENALIESMAMGIVPVVLNNPAERCIVENGNTGFIINSLDEFKHVIEWLHDNPIERQKIGKRAAKSVREMFSVEKTEASLNMYYRKILSMEKRKIDFSEIFGTNPAEWFLSCQNNKSIFNNDGSVHLNDKTTFDNYILFEETKGSVFHFNEYFPDNPMLKLWANNLKLLQ